MTTIDCISDLHGHFPMNLKGGDILIIAGDMTAMDKVPQWVKFYKWLKKQKYTHKIIIAGNHDGFLAQCISTEESKCMGLHEDEGFEYLCDSGCEVEGIKIYGTPWTPMLQGINPAYAHYMRDDVILYNKFLRIPVDTDILVSHGPAYGTLDINLDGEHCGSKTLECRINNLNLKYHIHGHIHEAYGQEVSPKGHTSINCAYLDRNYNPANKPVRIEM